MVAGVARFQDVEIAGVNVWAVCVVWLKLAIHYQFYVRGLVCGTFLVYIRSKLFVRALEQLFEAHIHIKVLLTIAGSSKHALRDTRIHIDTTQVQRIEIRRKTTNIPI